VQTAWFAVRPGEVVPLSSWTLVRPFSSLPWSLRPSNSLNPDRAKSTVLFLRDSNPIAFARPPTGSCAPTTIGLAHFCPSPHNQPLCRRAPTPSIHAPTQPPTTFPKLDHIRADVIPPRKLNTAHKHGPTPQTYKGQRIFEWVPQNPPLLSLSNHHLTFTTHHI
jgi:hypothetical protein